MNWTTACTDWQERIVAGRPLIALPPLFPSESADSLSIFNSLHIVDAVGQPTMGMACKQWVPDFVGSIFGAYDPETGRRLITEFFLLISKKNGKSTIAAGIMLTALIRNWRDSAEFLILAPTKEVADNSFVPARDMIRVDEELSAIFHVQDHYRLITHRGTKASLRIVAADAETVSGKKATGVLVDELWLFGKRHNAENMLREACGGLASRPEGFVVYLSTQSDDSPAGVFKQKLEYARGVRDGEIEDRCFLPVLYEFPPGMIAAGSHKDKKNFYVTNPNLGVSVDEFFLEREFNKAQDAGEESLCGFMAKHLNVEVGLALKSRRWAGADFWECQAAGVTLDDILEKSDVITVGCDGGGLDDMLGMAVLGRDAEDNRIWRLWVRAWVHPIALERRKGEAPRYSDFERDGDLVVVNEIGQDIEQFCGIVMRCERTGLLDRIGVDPAGIGDIVDALVDLDLDFDRVVGIPQGWRMNGAIKATERRVAEGKLLHGGQPLMAWCVSNARVEQKGNAISVTKQASGTGKIDPLVATFAAVALMAMNPEPRSGRSVYEERGFLSF